MYFYFVYEYSFIHSNIGYWQVIFNIMPHEIQTGIRITLLFSLVIFIGINILLTFYFIFNMKYIVPITQQKWKNIKVIYFKLKLFQWCFCFWFWFDIWCLHGCMFDILGGMYLYEKCFFMDGIIFCSRNGFIFECVGRWDAGYFWWYYYIFFFEKWFPFRKCCYSMNVLVVGMLDILGVNIFVRELVSYSVSVAHAGYFWRVCIIFRKTVPNYLYYGQQ